VDQGKRQRYEVPTSADATTLTRLAIRELHAVVSATEASISRRHGVQAAVYVELLASKLREHSSARAAILEALEDAFPEPVSNLVLRHVSGIQAFPRRVRELREAGHQVVSTGDGYRLAKVTSSNPRKVPPTPPASTAIE
jgi:biotin operon repressor